MGTYSRPGNVSFVAVSFLNVDRWGDKVDVTVRLLRRSNKLLN